MLMWTPRQTGTGINSTRAIISTHKINGTRNSLTSVHPCPVMAIESLARVGMTMAASKNGSNLADFAAFGKSSSVDIVPVSSRRGLHIEPLPQTREPPYWVEEARGENLFRRLQHAL